MKSTLATIVIALLLSTAYANGKDGSTVSSAMNLTQIETDLLAEMVGDESAPGHYSVKIMDTRGEVIEEAEFDYGCDESKNSMSYKQGYTIRIKLEDGSSNDFVLRN